MKINNQVIVAERVENLIKEIKKKSELEQVSLEFVKTQLKKYLQQNLKLVNFLMKEKISYRSNDYKKIVKSVRANLRRYHGLFQEKDQLKKRNELFLQILNVNDKDELEKKIVEILKTHSSTKERLSFYSRLYEKIFSIIGKPQKIIDLGAGLNPLSIVFMEFFSPRNKFEYLAYDINEKEANDLNLFFNKISDLYPRILGRARTFDLREFELVRKLPRSDVAFLFKVTDVLDRGKGHKMSENVISNIRAKFIVVSFPTITASGKPMKYPKRKWVELMCKRLEYEFDLIKMKNEIFYIILKN